jgi:hypothetical protein
MNDRSLFHVPDGWYYARYAVGGQGRWLAIQGRVCFGFVYTENEIADHNVASFAQSTYYGWDASQFDLFDEFEFWCDLDGVQSKWHEESELE